MSKPAGKTSTFGNLATGTHALRRSLARVMIRGLSEPDLVQSDTGQLPATGIFRILVCRVSHTLGNTLLLTPLLQELERVYPGAEIDIVTRSPVADQVFGGFYGVRSIFVLPRWGFAHPLRFLGVLRQLRKNRYDLVIDPDPRSSTGRALLNRSRSSYTLGFVGPHKRGPLSHPVAVPPRGRLRAGQRPVFLLRSALGTNQDMPATDMPLTEYPLPDIRLRADECEHGREALERVLAGTGAADRKDGVIGIFANATGDKKLGTDWWTRFLRVLETGSPGHAIVEIIPASATSLLDSRYPAYYSSSVRKLGAVLSNLALYISADCGIMHLANASGAATIGLFSGTDTSEWAPYGPGNHAVETSDRTPEQVAEAVLTLLKPAFAQTPQPDRLIGA
jgi:heptosyltransferase-3